MPPACLPKGLRLAAHLVPRLGIWDPLHLEDACRVTQAHVVGGHQVLVFDGCIPDSFREMLYMKAESSAYQQKQHDLPELMDHRYNTNTHPVDEVFHSDFGKLIKHLSKAVHPTCAAGFECTAAFTDALTFGDSTFQHTDATSFTKDIATNAFYTIVTHPNPEWLVDWGGETVFYTGRSIDALSGKPNRFGEVAASVLPRPGRVLLFDSRVRYASRPPQKICLRRRFSITLRLTCSPDTPLLRPVNGTLMEIESKARLKQIEMLKLPLMNQVPPVNRQRDEL